MELAASIQQLAALITIETAITVAVTVAAAVAAMLAAVR